MNPLDFDVCLGNGSIYDDPYPIYYWMRNNSPLYRSKIKNAWVITRYSDIIQIVASKDITSSRSSIQTTELPLVMRPVFDDFFSGWLMYQDSKAHTELRKKTKKLVNEVVIKSVAAATEKLSQSILENLLVGKKMDLIKDYFEPLAINAVCEIFNIPQRHHGIILKWSKNIISFMQGRYDSLGFDVAAEHATRSIENIKEYLKILFMKSSTMFKKNNLTLTEFTKISTNIIVDGYDPLINASTNSIITLSNNLSARMDVISKGISADIIQELIRYDPPFQYIVRYSNRDFDHAGVRILKGDRLLLMIASANRDTELLSNPDFLIFDRKANNFLSFGIGSHSCIGMNLSMQIMQIGIRNILSTIPDFNIDKSKVIRNKSLGSRAVVSLPIYW